MAKRTDQPSDPTIELSESQLFPVGTTPTGPAALAAAAAAAAKKRAAKAQQDVSLWRGEVVASSDFAPAARKRPAVRLWLLLLLFGAIGVAGGVVALKLMKDPEPAATPEPVNPVVTPPATTPSDAAAAPVAVPVDAAPAPVDAGVTPVKPAIKSDVPVVKKKSIVKKKKKKAVKRRTTKKRSSSR